MAMRDILDKPKVQAASFILTALSLFPISNAKAQTKPGSAVSDKKGLHRPLRTPYHSAQVTFPLRHRNGKAFRVFVKRMPFSTERAGISVLDNKRMRIRYAVAPVPYLKTTNTPEPGWSDIVQKRIAIEDKYKRYTLRFKANLNDPNILDAANKLIPIKEKPFLDSIQASSSDVEVERYPVTAVYIELRRRTGDSEIVAQTVLKGLRTEEGSFEFSLGIHPYEEEKLKLLLEEDELEFYFHFTTSQDNVFSYAIQGVSSEAEIRDTIKNFLTSKNLGSGSFITQGDRDELLKRLRAHIRTEASYIGANRKELYALVDPSAQNIATSFLSSQTLHGAEAAAVLARPEVEANVRSYLQALVNSENITKEQQRVLENSGVNKIATEKGERKSGGIGAALSGIAKGVTFGISGNFEKESDRRTMHSILNGYTQKTGIGFRYDSTRKEFVPASIRAFRVQDIENDLRVTIKTVQVIQGEESIGALEPIRMLPSFKDLKVDPEQYRDQRAEKLEGKLYDQTWTLIRGIKKTHKSYKKAVKKLKDLRIRQLTGKMMMSYQYLRRNGVVLNRDPEKVPPDIRKAFREHDKLIVGSPPNLWHYNEQIDLTWVNHALMLGKFPKTSMFEQLSILFKKPFPKNDVEKLEILHAANQKLETAFIRLKHREGELNSLACGVEKGIEFFEKFYEKLMKEHQQLRSAIRPFRNGRLTGVHPFPPGPNGRLRR